MPNRSRKNNLFKTRMSKRRKRVSTRRQRGGDGDEYPKHGNRCKTGIDRKFEYVAKTYKRGNLKDVPKVLICKKSRKMLFSNKKKLSSQLPNNKQKDCMNKHCYHLPTAYERLIYRKQIEEAKRSSSLYYNLIAKSLKEALKKLRERLDERTKRLNERTKRLKERTESNSENRPYALRNYFFEQGAKAGFEKEIEEFKKEFEKIKGVVGENKYGIRNLINDCESLIKRIKEDTRTKIQSNNNNNNNPYL